MNRSKFRGFMPVIVFFVILNAFLISGRHMLERWHVDQDVVILGNLVLFVVTLISFLLAKKGMNHTNPHVFIRSVYMSVMLKLFVCMIAAFLYISMYKKGLNKPALFGCMGLYIVYTSMEISILMKMLKQKKNG